MCLTVKPVLRAPENTKRKRFGSSLKRELGIIKMAATICETRSIMLKV